MTTMISQYLDTQEVLRMDVRPGMLVRYKGKTWLASANTRGKLYLHSLHEATSTNTQFVAVCIDKRGQLLTH